MTFIAGEKAVRAASERLDYLGLQARFSIALGQRFQDAFVKEIKLGLGTDEIVKGFSGFFLMVISNYLRAFGPEDRAIVATAILATMIDATERALDSGEIENFGPPPIRSST